MSHQLKRFLLDESGLETVEWAILGGVIVATTAALFASIGQDMFRAITSIQGETATIP
jgi:Flp pilus assembly pilin Flp